MIYSLQDNVIPRRLVYVPRETLITIQPIAPNPIRIGTSQLELSSSVGAVQDGIQINPPIDNTNIFQIRWQGWLWIIGVNAAPAISQGVILIPALEQGV